MAGKSKKKTTLNSRQQRHLRGLAHHLPVKATVGKEGITGQVLQSLNEVIDANELVKIKLQENFPHDRKEGGALLAAETGTALVQVIGRMVVLYRGNPDLPADKRVELPR
ncbi:MAG: YhbY family RNA-binding protein [Desulfurivibrionaceae bacterium]|nr:YhbY family RNA-binding protein [Desulfobulbales bacterium]MDT8334334.1 YhbY family RNA-binding protein [Desulfurivibrionaceae bacterium]